MTTPITILKPGVTRAEATRKLGGSLTEIKRGRLALVMDFYIPYLMFEALITNANQTMKKLMAIDAVTGTLDPYIFDHVPSEDERAIVESERALKAEITEAAAFEILGDKIKRMLYLKGFFRVKDVRINGRYLETLHVPYWVGIYRRNRDVRIEAVNAVRGVHEGTKVRELIAGWFHSRRQVTE
jgi:hypothetical protein